MAQVFAKVNVLEEVRRFAERVQQIDEVARFRLAEKKINESSRVQQLIAAIKRVQKELVHAEHYDKEAYKKELETRLTRLNKELDHLPIVREYQQSQVEMNDLLQLIQHAIASEVAKVVDVETGGEVKTGCGAGGPCGCRR